MDKNTMRDKTQDITNMLLSELELRLEQEDYEALVSVVEKMEKEAYKSIQ